MFEAAAAVAIIELIAWNCEARVGFVAVAR